MFANRLLSCSLLAMLAAGLSGCERRVDAGPRADRAAATQLRKLLLAKAEAKPEGGEAATEQPVTGWGTLHAQVKFVGAPPKPKPIDANKDQHVCAKHPLVEEGLVVGPDGGLANTVIFLRTSKTPVHPDYAASAEAEVVLDNARCRFEPHVQVLRTTQTLVVKNSDNVGHNSKIDGFANPGFNGLIPAHSALSQKFSKEESNPIPVGCNIHPWMKGWVVVRSDPYAAVSNTHGELTIAKLPAGRELEFQLWHETGGFLKTASTEGVKLYGKGRFKVKLDPDQELKITINVPAEGFSK